jgi:hypothetical protein
MNGAQFFLPLGQRCINGIGLADVDQMAGNPITVFGLTQLGLALYVQVQGDDAGASLQQ